MSGPAVHRHAGYRNYDVPVTGVLFFQHYLEISVSNRIYLRVRHGHILVDKWGLLFYLLKKKDWMIRLFTKKIST